MIKNTLTGKQKSFLRSMGMTLDPVVNMGKEGVTPTVVQAAQEAIKKRELIKVRVLQNCFEEPEDADHCVVDIATKHDIAAFADSDAIRVL